MDTAIALGGILVGLGGLAVAYLTFRMTAQERTAGIRQALYQAQINAIVELSAAVSSFSVASLGAIHKVEKTPLDTLDDDARAQVTVETGAQFEAVGKVLFQYWAVLPNTVLHTLDDLLDAYSAVTASGSERAKWPPHLVSDPSPARLVGAAGAKAMIAIRLALGTDPLSKQTLDRIQMPRP